jgi:hypothetical protein
MKRERASILTLSSLTASRSLSILFFFVYLPFSTLGPRPPLRGSAAPLAFVSLSSLFHAIYLFLYLCFATKTRPFIASHQYPQEGILLALASVPFLS